MRVVLSNLSVNFHHMLVSVVRKYANSIHLTPRGMTILYANTFYGNKALRSVKADKTGAYSLPLVAARVKGVA